MTEIYIKKDLQQCNINVENFSNISVIKYNREIITKSLIIKFTEDCNILYIKDNESRFINIIINGSIYEICKENYILKEENKDLKFLIDYKNISDLIYCNNNIIGVYKSNIFVNTFITNYNIEFSKDGITYTIEKDKCINMTYQIYIHYFMLLFIFSIWIYFRDIFILMLIIIFRYIPQIKNVNLLDYKKKNFILLILIIIYFVIIFLFL